MFIRNEFKIWGKVNDEIRSGGAEHFDTAAVAQQPAPRTGRFPRPLQCVPVHAAHITLLRESVTWEREKWKKKKKSGPFWELLKHILVVSSVALKKIRRKLLFLF